MSYALLFLVAVVAEVSSLVVVGSWLGAGYTLGLLVLAVMLGFALLSGRGLSTVQQAVGATSKGESVTPALVNGALLALAGVLLIVPGFVSDAVAVLLVLPPVRRLLSRRLHSWARGRMKDLKMVRVPGHDGPRPAGDVIDVEAVEQPAPGRPQLPN